MQSDRSDGMQLFLFSPVERSSFYFEANAFTLKTSGASFDAPARLKRTAQQGAGVEIWEEHAQRWDREEVQQLQEEAQHLRKEAAEKRRDDGLPSGSAFDLLSRPKVAEDEPEGSEEAEDELPAFL